MADVKTTLTIAGENTNSFSNSRNYTEEVVTKFYIDNTETFTDLIQFSPDDDSPTKTGTSLGAAKSFCIYNSGNTGVEIQLITAKWTTNTDPHTQSSDSQYITMLLGVGEIFFSSNMRLIETSHDNGGGVGATSALALASNKVAATLTATVAKGGDTIANVDGAVAADGTTLTVHDAAEKFRAGDYVFMDLGTDDVFKVVSVDSATTMTIERDVLGYTGQILTDTTDLNMYAGSHLHDKGTEDDTGVNIRTDKQGRFKGMLLGDSGVVPRGTVATAVAGGIVPGSVSIQFPENGGYQNLGVSISSGDTTGLAVSTGYEFRITDYVSGAAVTTNDILFTTDSSDVSWGKVIALINTAFVDANLDYTCAIVNGDVRFSAKKWIDGDRILLVDPTDGTEPWSVGNVPDTAAHEKPVKTRFPYATVTDIQSGKKIKNTKHMLIDDGNGNLRGDIGSGTIDYDSGVIDIRGLYRAEFKTSFNFGSAHAGIPTRASNLENMVSLIAARSTNSLKNGEITLVCYS